MTRNATNIYAGINLLIFCFFPSVLPASECEQDASGVYSTFKAYRLLLDSVDRLDTISPFFSKNFNQYYQSKIKSENADPAYSRYLTQYWDNLLTGKQILIVLNNQLECNNNTWQLKLTTVLESNFNVARKQAEIVRVTVHFLKELEQWKIDSFEFDEHPIADTIDISKIVDNYLQLD